ncbi:MAG: DUF348 domain-containing protein [Firmicutes bacterium]|nr:DUF348 domain-containing protein [Bacillota bacterium]
MAVLSLSIITFLSIKGKHVTVLVDDNKISLYTFKTSVQNAINESGINVSKNDIVTPSLVSSLNEGQTIKITRVNKQQLVQEREIPFEVIRKPDHRLPTGIEKVKQQGSNGIKKLVYQTTLHNGVEVSRKLISSEIVSRPQSKVIAVGKRPAVMLAARGSGANITMGEGFEAEATAYTFTGYNTATGITPYRGVVAVDPSIIPLGTKLFIEGYGKAEALDTGGSIKGNRIDLFFPTREQALKWGRKVVKVTILKD